MPEFSVRNFMRVNDGGRGKYIRAKFRIWGGSFHAGYIGIFLMTGESETSFGNVFTSNDDFQPGMSNAGHPLQFRAPISAAFLCKGKATLHRRI